MKRKFPAYRWTIGVEKLMLLLILSIFCHIERSEDKIAT